MNNVKRVWQAMAVWSVITCGIAAVAQDKGMEKTDAPPSYRWINAEGGSWNEGKNWSIGSDKFPAAEPPNEKTMVTVLTDKNVLTTISLEKDVEAGTAYFQNGRVQLDLKGHTLAMTRGYVLFGVHPEYVMTLTAAGGRVVTGPGFVNIGHWAKSHGEVIVRGGGTSWGLQGACGFSVGSYGNGVLRIEGGAKFESPDEAVLAVAAMEGSTGAVVLQDKNTTINVGQLFVGGGQGKAGGAGRVEVGAETIFTVRKRWTVWPGGTVLVESGGYFDIAPDAAVEVRGAIGGSGLIQRVVADGAEAAPGVIKSDSGLYLKLEGEPLKLRHFDYEQTPTAIIRVALPQFKARAGGGLVVEPVERTVKIDGGTVEVTFAEKGRYGSGTAFDMIIAGHIEMIAEPKVVVTGEIGKRWTGKVMVTKITAGPMAGREALRVVLGGKR